MYAKYRPCPQPQQLAKTSVPFCPPAQAPGPGAIPESTRMIRDQCPSAWVTTYQGPAAGETCGAPESLTTRTVRVQIPVALSAPMPYVEVGTTPASVTLQQTQTNTIAAASNPYDPATRFAQYFPPAPIPYICPERIPNNLPLPPDVCVPITRFKGSTQGPQTT
jgi:hypothetical protein